MFSVRDAEILVVGAGPAGLSAALSAAQLGARVTVVDRQPVAGGQLIKQTHMFFGSKEQQASIRGFDIAARLATAVLESDRVDLVLDATVLGRYPDGVLLVEQRDAVFAYSPRRLVVATGAAEKFLAFPNNDLPGIYGAGAVQTLMNVYGVVPGRKVLMVGAGNIGLIVTYQLLQAGVDVVAVIDAAPVIGGYWVHASKIRRMGVPILTSHAVKCACGHDVLEGAIVHRLDEDGSSVPGTEQEFSVDVMCLAVGLSPLTELLFQAGCRMKYVPELGGHVPVRNEFMETSVSGIYVAGDVAGIEEASTAMVEGNLAGSAAAASLGYGADRIDALATRYRAQLSELRRGPTSEKVRKGLAKL